MNEPAGPNESNEQNESTWAASIKSILGWRIKTSVGGRERIGQVIETLKNLVRKGTGEPVFEIHYSDGGRDFLSYSEIMRECVLIEPPGGPVNWNELPVTRPYKPGATY